ncbi:phage portal protein [Glycomyces paridis]|uniref:phage portal protein n=1 Tax=Glycomyces paridis TaxID=2126555 RepID=UPI0013054037|nr:phage portal protein [Glycomyces paridis]
MPLDYAPGTVWPPEEYDLVNAQIGIWAAWHSGDIDQLTTVYSDVTDTTPAEHEKWRPIRKIYSLLRRWFWRQASNTRRPRQRVHVPLAGDIAQASAGLLFAEPPTVECEHKATAEKLEEILPDIWRALSEGAEICAALGGVYPRILWDEDGPRITVTHPDAAVPEFRQGRLRAVTLWRVIRHEGQTVVRHLERHERDEQGHGVIEHSVYVGTVTQLGHVVPLTDYPETAHIQIERDGNQITTGTDRLTAGYVPNLLPNRIWRHLPQASSLGVSDYSGLETMLDMLDLTYSSWARSVDQAQGKLIVPRQYLNDQGPGEGAVFDMDQETFQPVDSLDGTVNLAQVQFKIPVDELDRTVDRIKGDIVNSAGYSPRTFGLDQGVTQATATEVNALDSKDEITKARKIGYWRPVLEELLRALLDVGKAKFQWDVDPEAPLTIEWGGGADIDDETKSRILANWEAARAASTEEKVKFRHPEWEQTAVDEEVKRIHKEQAIGQAEDPGSFRGGFGDEDNRDSPAVVGERPATEEPEGA